MRPSEPRTAEPPLVTLRDVSVRRGSGKLLEEISLQIPVGRNTAVLGPNGAGKTSLLRLLTRQYYPSVEVDGPSGEISILGRSDWNVSELRRQMGVVSSTLDQHYSGGRSGRMRVEEAVACGYTATELAAHGVRLTPQVQREVEHALQRVQAAHLLGRTTETLSTGERRRVLIARALVHRPAILILDEPTTGLDLAARWQFLGTLQHLTQSPRTTVVLVTHHIEEIVPGFMHVVLLDRGRVVYDGDRREALTEPRISRLFGVPLRLRRGGDGRWQASVAPGELSPGSEPAASSADGNAQ
jgi:iron complex transport system ATP-binding protein